MGAVRLLRGRVELAFRVDRDGGVRWVYPRASTVGDRDTERCLIDIATVMRFQRPRGCEAEFAYPPTRRTIQETLKEVQRCTREGVTINTFMLERSEMLMAFVEQMARINRGRAFFATPERLGEYVLVDYVGSKRRKSA